MPYPLCAQGWVLRRLIDDPDHAVHPDALETFNPTALGRPWHDRVVRFADQHRLAHVGNSDAHSIEAIGTGWTTFEGRTAADLRAAITAGGTEHGGSFHGASGQVGVFGRQLRKRAVDARDEVVGRVRRSGTGRDHGYPGGRDRPPRYDPGEGPR
ncbi:MAG: PHP-associated domain-containing protein [Candidatus Limnocylindrales bacterium]